MMPLSRSPSALMTTATTLLFFIGLSSSSTSALTLPNLIGVISSHHHQQRRHSSSHHLLDRRGRNNSSASQKSPNNHHPANNGGNQMHSITLTIDNEDPSGLWNVMSSSRRSSTANQQQQQQRRFIRFGFNFFRVGRHHGLDNTNVVGNVGVANHKRAAAAVLQQPFGPAPRGGTLDDVVLLPSAAATATTAALSLQASSSSSSSTKNNDTNSRLNNHSGLWSNVRTTMRGIRRTVIHSAISLSGIFPNNTVEEDSDHHHHGGGFVGMMHNHNSNNNLFDRHGDGAAVNNMIVLRVGGMINRHLKSKSRGMKHPPRRVVVMEEEEVYLVDNDEHVGVGFDVNKAVMTAARGGDASTTTTTSTLSSVSSSAAVSSSSASSFATSTTSNTATEETTFIIETPLFPIILPKSWEAPFKGTSSYSSSSRSSTATSTTSSSSYIASLEITIAPPEDITSSTTATTVGAKPSSHQLQAVTLPLIPKSTWESFTGNEFFFPQTYDGLVSTGVLMGSTVMSEEYVNWSGDKKTEKFLKDHSSNDGSGSSWYEALDSSQEVLVWSGKFIDNTKDKYGAELPIIKTTSIIHKSPKYLAELLMDSTKVKAYNKMSLGRDDVEVFQTGVDTKEEEGKFGNVGESKIVRNLTRPPMVNSNLEFVTCMHARKLSQQDLQTLSSNNNDPNQPTDGYIVVSRAVTGGQWNSADSNNVRNEIILGVNILRQVPNEPDKTELIAITHVYSPMIPLMLAKNAGVKGAVDFVRDIRSLP